MQKGLTTDAKPLSFVFVDRSELETELIREAMRVLGRRGGNKRKTDPRRSEFASNADGARWRGLKCAVRTIAAQRANKFPGAQRLEPLAAVNCPFA